MTANQIAWTKEKEAERANRENEAIQKAKIQQAYQEMWLNYQLGVQNQALQRAQIESRERISLNEIASKERMDYFNRESNFTVSSRKNELEEFRLNNIEVPRMESDVNRNKVRNIIETSDSIWDKITWVGTKLIPMLI